MFIVKKIMVSDEIEIEVEVEFSVYKGIPQALIDPEEYPRAEIISITPVGESDVKSIELNESLIDDLKEQCLEHSGIMEL